MFTFGKIRLVAAALCGPLIAFAPELAQAGNESRSEAHPLPDGLFEVIADFSESAIYWCGAGTYAQNVLGRAQSDRIHVWRGPAPSQAKPGRKSVQFGLDAPPGTKSGSRFSTDVKIIGNSLSVSQAREKCNERTSSG